MSGSSVWMTVRRRLSMGLLLLVLLLQVLLTAAVRRNDHVFHKIQTSRRLPIVVHRLEDFHHLQKEHSLSDIQVIGNTSAVSASHPTIQLILQRWKTASTPGRRDLNDTKRIALCIEGGGMRGCVSAGAVAAINFLGLNDAVDVVYGSSAGAMIGAYFVSRQYAGLSIYSEVLPRAGTKFIDKTKLLPAAGIPFDALLARKKFDSLSKAFMNRLLKQRLQANTVASSTVSSTAVLNLDFLLESVMREKQALDWDTFIHNEVHQPLRIIASNAKTLSSIALSFDRGHYQDIDSLLKCIRASMLVPGVTDPLLSLENQTFVSMKVIKDIAVIAQNASQSESSAASLMKKIKSMPRWNVPQMIESGTNMTKNAWQDMLNKNATANFKLDSIKTLKVFQAWMAKRPNRPKPLRKWDRKQILDRVSALGPRGMKQYNKAKLQSSLRKNRTAIHTKWQHKNHNLNTFSTNQTTDPSHLCDALLCEPIPYRSAITEADHLIVLRTKPDPCVVLGKGSSVYDIFIAQRFFKEHGADEAVEWIQDLQHQKIYAEDVLLLNEGAKGLVDGINIGNKNIHLLPIAPIGDVTEVSQLETRRENIIYGIRTGARRVLEIFWPILSSSTNSSHEGLSLEDNEVTIDELLDLIVPSVPPKSKDGPNQADIINDLLYSIDSLAESYTTTNGIKL